MGNFSCPICGGGVFVDFRGRTLEECKKCKSKARERAEFLAMRCLGYLESSNSRILHIQPEKSLGTALKKLSPNGYHPKTIKRTEQEHEDYQFYSNVDSLIDSASEYRYHVILHNHFLETIQDLPTTTVSRLDSLLEPGGVHMFTVTIRGVKTDEGGDLMLNEADRVNRFGNASRYRLFGSADFPRTLAAMRSQRSPRFNYLSRFPESDLERWRIPASEFRDINSNTVFTYISPTSGTNLCSNKD